MPSIHGSDQFITISHKGPFAEWKAEYYYQRLIRVEFDSEEGTGGGEGIKELTVYFHNEVDENPLGPAYYDALLDLLGDEIMQLIRTNSSKYRWNGTVSIHTLNDILRKLPLHVLRDCRG